LRSWSQHAQLCHRGDVAIAAGEHREVTVRIYRALQQSIERIAPDSPAAYLFATVLVAIAAVLRFGIAPFGNDVLPFVTFFPATLFAAFIGGLRPGLYAAALGGMIGWWGFIPPFYAFLPLTYGSVVGLVVYAFTSLIIVLGANHHRSVIGRLRAEEGFRQMVVDELAHRLKNKVATIQSIIAYQLRDNPQLKDVISRRLNALSATDDLIMAAQGKGAPIDEIISTELLPYERERTRIEGPKILLPPRLALSMALIVHELATNAAKHGALSSPSGRVSIQWRVLPGQESAGRTTTLSVEWHETGGPVVSPPAIRGFGLRLLAVALEQFNGMVETVFQPAGFICRMNVPLPANADASGDEERETLAPGERSGSSLTQEQPFVHSRRS
jgi:two-component sensor histidine kinase